MSLNTEFKDFYTRLKTLPSDSITENGLAFIKQNPHLTRKQNYRIAKTLVAKNRWKLIENIAEFNLHRHDRYKIAKRIANVDAWFISQNIDKFDLNSKRRAKIAEAALSQNAVHTLRFFPNYRLNPANRLHVVLNAAVINGGATSEFFPQLQIVDKREIYMVAKEAFTHDPDGSRKHIENYHFADENIRFQMFNLAIEKNPQSARKLLSKFAITDPELVSAAAIKYAKNDCTTLACELAQWDLPMETRRVQIAEIFVDQEPWLFLKKIEIFNIQDKSIIASLIEKAILKNEAKVGDAVKKANIDGSMTYNLALKMAAQSPQQFAADMKNWPLEILDEEQNRHLRELTSIR